MALLSILKIDFIPLWSRKLFPRGENVAWTLVQVVQNVQKSCTLDSEAEEPQQQATVRKPSQNSVGIIWQAECITA